MIGILALVIAIIALVLAVIGIVLVFFLSGRMKGVIETIGSQKEVGEISVERGGASPVNGPRSSTPVRPKEVPIVPPNAIAPSLKSPPRPKGGFGSKSQK